MKNKNLFQEAIADAKAIRETALANAKAALEETLTPKLQSMLAAKLNEMEDEESHFEEQEELEEIDISSVLAELEQEETLEEKKDESEEDESEEDESEEDESEEIKDMTVEELKELIKGIVSDELGNEEETPLDIDAEEETEMEDDTSSEEEINLDELLAELDDLEQEEIDEVEVKNKEEMEEALKTIKFLRKELNEVNLLNAKLLYVNKIFKSKNLTESQKIQVITSFDKATNVKEAKIVYESLTNTLSSNVKKTIVKESLGFASKAAGTAFKKQIVESNEVVNRMQKLANIIK